MKRIALAVTTMFLLTGCSHGSKANSRECKQISSDYFAAMQYGADHLTQAGAIEHSFAQGKAIQEKARAAGCPVPDVFADLRSGSPSTGPS